MNVSEIKAHIREKGYFLYYKTCHVAMKTRNAKPTSDDMVIVAIGTLGLGLTKYRRSDLYFEITGADKMGFNFNRHCSEVIATTIDDITTKLIALPKEVGEIITPLPSNRWDTNFRYKVTSIDKDISSESSHVAFEMHKSVFGDTNCLMTTFEVLPDTVMKIPIDNGNEITVYGWDNNPD